MTGWPSSWLDWFFAGEPTSAGEGVQRSIKGSWSLAPWMTVLLAVAVTAIVIYAYVRERSSTRPGWRGLLVVLRLAALAIIAFMLAQFMITQSRTGLPHVVVLVDDSASMGIVDRYDDEKMREKVADLLKSAKLEAGTRLDQARALLLADNARLLRKIDGQYKLKLYFVSDRAEPITGELDDVLAEVKARQAQGQSTRLGQSVHAVLNDLRGAPPSALILLSDGINTDGESLVEAANYALRKNVPMFTVALGSQTPVRDLELSDLLVDEVVFVDDVVNFECKLTATGLEGRNVEVVLREKDDPTPLATIDVSVGADGKPQKVRIPYRPTKVGQFEYVVEARAIAGEVNADNNAQQRLVMVRKEQIRVLLVQLYPSFEFRYLKQMLQRDSTISLRTVLQESDLDYAETDQTALRVFPVLREELFEYDVVIFGDVDPSYFNTSAVENLSAFVTQKGGGLVFIAGPQFMPNAYRDSPLSTLIPIDFSAGSGPDGGVAIEDGFQVEPTELGLTMPTMQLGDTLDETTEIWQKLPPLYWLYEAPALKPAARVFAQARLADRTSPVIVLQYVGAGKVVFHAVDDTWRWRWRVGDVYFARYWVQTLRYLARSKLLGKERTAELTVDRREYRRGESARLRVRFLDERRAPSDDDGVVVMIEHEGHPNRRLPLVRDPSHRGIFEGVVSKPADGKYHLWITSPALDDKTASADFRVVPPPGEFEHVQMDYQDLKRAAEETKGRVYTIADASKLLDDLPEGQEVPIESLPPKVLWNHWLVLFVLVTVLTGEWITRKFKGML